MNIFAVHPDPEMAAQMLPDKHVVKMPTETAQMLAVICGPAYKNIGTIPKKDGTPYRNDVKSIISHPCTKWAAKNNSNLIWLVQHGIALCEEYTFRYDKIHSAESAIFQALGNFVSEDLFVAEYRSFNPYIQHVRAMPDELKHNKNIDDYDAYRIFIRDHKPWAKDNYKNKRSAPGWLINYAAISDNK